MTFSLSYCPDGLARIARLRSLYERRAGDRIFARMSVSGPTLARFASRHAAGYTARPDPAERAAFWDAVLQDRMAVEDDVIPCAYLSEQDQGLYGGLVGGDVQYMTHPDNGWISSMVPPILADLSGLDRLRIDRGGEAFRYFEESLAVLVKQAEGRFGISHFILIDSLNFVFELVGATRTYLAVEDEPERVRQAIDFAFGLNVMVQRKFFESVPLLEGGTCSNMAGWLPGTVVSESVDPFHMTSVAYFERWGREPVERILGEFDGGVIHIHGNGRHLLPAVASIRGLKAVALFNDKGYPPAIYEARRLQSATGDLPLIVSAEFTDFVAAYESGQLTGGTLYLIEGVPDAATANLWMERIRAWCL
jgi:hypothetical protein